MASPDPAPDKRPGSVARQFALATELPFLLAGGALAGGFLGFLLDRWWHTKPFLMILLGAVGFFAGLRDVLRRVQADDQDAGPKSGQ
jgi:F0F1-type ATP synthase assembly protein I